MDHRSTLLDGLRQNGYLKALYVLFTVLFSGLVLSVHIEEILHKVLRIFRSPT